MPERLRQLGQWLVRDCRLPDFTVEPASADASFRRYFRVTLGDGASWVAMDAPPDKEDCRAFVDVAARMAAAGLHVPQIVERDFDQGFLLLEDLGDCSYLAALDEGSADRLYGDAIGALLRLQADAETTGLPRYDHAMLLREMQLFVDWLLLRHLGLSLDASEAAMLKDCFGALAANAQAQPQVCVHRDYHSRNLMLVEHANPGVIDFQDAVSGPVTYDLVSLLRDCYIAWPEDRVEGWLADYHARAADIGLVGGADLDGFRAWFDLMGIQRHLKAAGIFARLHHRDGKPGYLADIPRTLGYVAGVGVRYPESEALAGYIAEFVLPRL